MPKIMIADVQYTATDETYYVLNRDHKDAEKYQAETLESVFDKLKAEGWLKCGRVNKADNSLAEMLTNSRGDYIAVWDE